MRVVANVREEDRRQRKAERVNFIFVAIDTSAVVSEALLIILLPIEQVNV
jgi:hypothetical protein